MSDHDVRKTKERGFGQPAPGKQEDPDDGRPYLYRHAGIKERDGHIPFWLTLVVVGLLIWSIYYTVQYWNPS